MSCLWLWQKAIVKVANGAGVKTTALLTDMNQCLASSAGNALEVREAVRFLTGEQRNERLFEVTMAQSSELLVSGGLAADIDEARSKLQTVLDNGEAANIFGRMVAGLGGPEDFMDKYDNYLPSAKIINRLLRFRHPGLCRQHEYPGSGYGCCATRWWS